MAESIMCILHFDKHRGILIENERRFYRKIITRSLVSLKPKEAFLKKFLEKGESYLVLCQISMIEVFCESI